jgi:hypothetical protein
LYADAAKMPRHYSLAREGDPVLTRIAKAAQIPAKDGVTWKATVVATVGTDAAGQTVAYLQYVQDIEWPVTERNVLRLLIRMLRSRAGI